MTRNDARIASPVGRVGVILAAGVGTRLSSERAIKPLTKVAGITLIERTLRSLALAGCSEAVIVVGFQAQALQEAIMHLRPMALPFRFVVNVDYALSNGVSLLCAASEIGDEFVVAMADHVFGDEVMRLARLEQPPHLGATLAVDYAIDSVFDLDDATKVRAESGRLLAIGKDLIDYNCIDTGIFVCSRGLINALASCHRAAGDASISDGVRALAQSGHMSTFDIQGGFWQDIDNRAMLLHAEKALARRLSSERAH